MIKRITESFKNPLSLGIIPALAMALAFGLNYTYAAWSEPTSAPTGDNVAAPINVGNSNQTKNGGGIKAIGNTYGLWGSGSSYGVYGEDGGDGGYGYLGYGPYGVFSMSPIYAGGGLQLPTGAGAGKVLTSDASGNATWQVSNVAPVGFSTTIVSCHILNMGGIDECHANCPAGYSITGGGSTATEGNGPTPLPSGNYPSGNGWKCVTNRVNYNITCYAVCGRVQ